MSGSANPNRAKSAVAVIPFAGASTIAAKVIAAHVSGYLNLAVETLPPEKIPPDALDKRRMQYNAATLIQTVESMRLEDYFKVIALFDVDLFTPIFTHVFGEARQNGRVALVSLFRLESHMDGSSPPYDRVLERAAKIALHELGHLLNLLHCDDDRCLMYFSGSVDTLDQTGFNFCRHCRTALRRKLQQEGITTTPT
ncbi:archaemetzincin family Zn-dependent metalloprotease [uncultured Desulfosarcina sp.]|uniref:archaemetzincin family Zn-dependent metalloprotease n=1 Tax=uncultured Desulfosarcina sp. TaxID=218289 RepID=UPI0029C6E193|nr:archaemetzincin family Zn-dependent metalloprotease [uncultured Desulfosarcina sp.]